MNLCLACAGLGRTCCQDNDIVVTLGDLARISRRVGGDIFHERRPPTPGMDLGGENDPAWLQYTLAPDGRRRVLTRQAGGDCVFLAATGCRLPLLARPLICRLHPVVYTETGVLGLSEQCPRHLLPPGMDLLSVVEIDQAAVESWHHQLYAELREDFLAHSWVA